MSSAVLNREIQFQEKLDPALIPALYKNFRDPIQAILELVDNAIDDRVPGKQTVITAEIEKGRIYIVNKGGRGMGVDELNDFFNWGLSKKQGKLGRYGQGGKGAMGYLGKSWRISSTKHDEAEEYLIEDLDWDDRTKGFKVYKPEVKKARLIEEGVVQIEIWNQKRKINKNELKRTLGSVYRPLIISGEVEIHSDGKVAPLDIPLAAPEEMFEFKTSNGTAKGWLGFLPDRSNMKGGIMCYAFGRLITDKEFFGQKDPSYKASINKLIGEVYIDFEVPLLMNKGDFDRSSPEWEEIAEEMSRIMDPYISLLLEEKENDLPGEKEIKEAEHAGEIWKEFLKYRNNMQQEGSLPGLPVNFGQKQAEINTRNVDQIKELKEKTLKVKDIHEPATPPPLNAIGKRRRTGSYPEPVLQPLPEFMRYQVGEEDGKKVIKINTSFPVYKLRKQQLKLYIWETLVLEYAKAEEGDTQTVGEYVGEMNEFLGEFAKFLHKKNIA